MIFYFDMGSLSFYSPNAFPRNLMWIPYTENYSFHASLEISTGKKGGVYILSTLVQYQLILYNSLNC